MRRCSAGGELGDNTAIVGMERHLRGDNVRMGGRDGTYDGGRSLIARAFDAENQAGSTCFHTSSYHRQLQFKSDLKKEPTMRTLLSLLLPSICLIGIFLLGKFFIRKTRSTNAFLYFWYEPSSEAWLVVVSDGWVPLLYRFNRVCCSHCRLSCNPYPSTTMTNLLEQPLTLFRSYFDCGEAARCRASGIFCRWMRTRPSARSHTEGLRRGYQCYAGYRDGNVCEDLLSRRALWGRVGLHTLMKRTARLPLRSRRF